MTLQSLCKAAFAALLCVQAVNGFVRPAKTFSLQPPGMDIKIDIPSAPLQAATADFDKLPVFEVQDTYEQGKVPLFAVVNATMRTSKLIYAFSTMKLDIRENPDSWVDGSDMLKDGTLLEEEIGDFVKKNRDRIEETGLQDLGDYEMGLKGDNRLRCTDAKDSNKELVYGINVNRSRKQVTVAFRGTNTLKDVLVDLDGRRYMCTDGDETYAIHNGFRNYLNQDTGVDGDGDLTKLEQITEKLEDIMESDCNGFDVFVTGHSLGGALATLYGLRLAETKKFPVVNIVSYASPYVGCDGFKKVFRQAELDGIVRHIRVSNTNDCIPANPCIGGFKHVGMNLSLRKSGPVMNYEGVEHPSLPAAFIVFALSAGSLLVKFLSLFIEFLSIVPTIPLLPAVLFAYATATILLDDHWFNEHRKRFNTGLESADFLALTIEEAYGKRLESITKTGV